MQIAMFTVSTEQTPAEMLTARLFLR